ncbi:MAG: AMP-binding protein [bacterium]|nr:AMP-binding protein [bacterium]
MKKLLEDYDPDVIGIRTLTYYKDFFHEIVGLISHWKKDIPVIAGGPYATGSMKTILQDRNVDVVVRGEGEITFAALVEAILANNGKLPGNEDLKKIPGIAFNEKKDPRKKNVRELIYLEELEQNTAKISKDNPTHLNHPEDLAYIIFTSGSTGKPNGVMVEHKQVINCITWMQQKFGISAKDTIIQRTNLTFDPSVWEIFWPIARGAKIKLITTEQGKDAEYLIRLMTANKNETMMYCPASLVKAMTYLLKAGDRKPTLELPWLIIGAESIAMETVKEFYTYYKGKIVNTYGPTECTINNTYYDIEPEDPRTIVPIGKPIANNRIYILSEGMQLLPVNTPGEICIAGESLARGYINNSEKTARQFLENPFGKGTLYKTGDIGRWQLDGTIEIMGRKDQQVNIRGFRVELGEIETTLLKHDYIRQALVMFREKTAAHDENAEDGYICAYIVPAAERKLENTALMKEYLAKELPDYMIPAYIVPIDKIPLTRNGKVDKQALPEPELGTGQEYLAPYEHMDKKLAGIWAEVLAIDKELIGLNSDFFELGGHSLRAVILSSKINKEFGVEFPISRVFTGSTLRELGQYIKEAKVEGHQEIPPVEKRDYYPQSSAQKRLFFLDQMENIGTSYNSPLVLKIEGNADKKQFEKAFKELIKRHETLRTSFEIVADEPVQRVQDETAITFEIPEEPVTGEEVKQGLIDTMIKAFARPFDLKTAPLLRVQLVKQSATQQWLFFDMHHIISDGTSRGILVNDFTKLYAGETLPPLNIQYKDYSIWQNNHYGSAKINKEQEYWLNLYSDTGQIPELILPGDFPRPETMGFAGDTCRFIIEKEETEAIRKFEGKYGVTLFMSLLTLFDILLYKYTGQEDIVVGTGVMGRPHADLQEIIGFFINTLPLRNYPNESKTFVEFLMEIKQNTLAAFENQTLQFEALIDKLGIERNPKRHPLFDVFFIVQNFEEREVDDSTFGDIVFKPHKYEEKVARFDITLFAYEINNRLHFNLDYSTALFRKSTIEKFIDQYIEVFKQVVKDENIKLGDITISYGLEEASTQLPGEDDGDFSF